ncbi:MAG TPA: cbb3-type cytochrome c oxidase subunit I [Chthoniobacterales bacterium]|jgi:cytochrome c oxidase subunit 1
MNNPANEAALAGGPSKAIDHDHHDAHGHDHHELSFIQKYVFSLDHKVIGVQYLVTGLVFMMLGFLMMMLMRWQLANPGVPIPLIGQWLSGRVGEAFVSADGAMMPDFYNSMGAMHGTIMVFLGVVPIAFGAFGNFLVPLQIGAPDMSFPKMNMMSFWLGFIGGVIMLASFFVPGGAAKSGWTSYPPLSIIADSPGMLGIPQGWSMIFTGQTMWILAMVFLITSSLFGSINIITTVIQLRAPGMSWMRLPVHVWAQFITAYILLLAFPPLESAAIMQLMDRVFESSLFSPSGLVVNGIPFERSGGGSTLLWQHLFWFLAHPEVYVLILPALGIISEIISNNTRKPLWSYKAIVFSSLAVGLLSFMVWAHHMYLTGMGQKVSTFFQTTTVMISVPSVIIVTALLLSLWGGSIRFNTPMCFAVGFLPMFGIGGLTGIPLAFSSIGLLLHDTYYVIGHFHYVVAPGTIFALFAGIYFWYPKVTGRKMNETLGKIHFFGSLICMNGIFMPMFLQGIAGMHRRWYDGGATYDQLMTKPVLGLNNAILWAAVGLLIFQLPFIINFFWSIWGGKKVGDNPWDSTTLEWNTPTPPPHGNFIKPVTVYRGPNEYSVPGAPRDFSPQWEPNL